jgi:hypothetical protein
VYRRGVLVLLLTFLLLAAGTASGEGSEVPTDFRAVREGGRILLSWQPPLEGTVLDYYIYRGTEPDNLTFYDSVDVNYTAGYDLEVLRGTTYYYAISANFSHGEGVRSEVVEVPPPSDDLPLLVMSVILTVTVVTLLFAYWKGRVPR